jgi:hypothetical protein
MCVVDWWLIVTLEWDVTIDVAYPTPYVEFTFSLICEGDFDEECDLDFNIVGNYSHTYYYGREQTAKIDFVQPGLHQLEVCCCCCYYICCCCCCNGMSL